MRSLVPSRHAFRPTVVFALVRQSSLAAFMSAAALLTLIWIGGGPNSVGEIDGDARYYLDLWERPREPTAPPFTYRILTPWLVRLSGLDPFWGFAVVSILGLAVTGVLVWHIVLHDGTPLQAWLSLGMFVVSPAAVFSLADHYLVDAAAYAFLAGVLLLLQRKQLTWAALLCVVGLLAKESVLFAGPIVILLGLRARAWTAIAIFLGGAPTLYLILHRTNLMANGGGNEYSYFTEHNLNLVLNSQDGPFRRILIAIIVGFGPLAVAAALGWRYSPTLIRYWAILLIPFTCSALIAVDATRMLAYSAVVFAPIAAQRIWSTAGAALVLGATAVSSIGVQRMPPSWRQVIAGASLIAAYTALARQRRFLNEPLDGMDERRD